ncbi:MAG: nicotinate (nicotinamide) nucleotide adenylyltransferase, partial [Burkholderiales bacterium]|nr:nicotinate (nicotinamide) nucleotide adenylyltransferase [Burkholderiales bacterium]
MRIGILGGTFDPVHTSHLLMAEEAKKQLQLDKLFLVPTRPWQKTARASDQQRLDMLRLAVKDTNCPAEIDTRELDQAGQSYTINTLYAYRKEYGDDAELYFIMGTDQWNNLGTWVQWELFPELVNLVLFKREGASFEDPYKERWPVMKFKDAKDFVPHGRIYLCDTTPPAVSSSEIRDKLYQEPERSEEIPGLIKGVQEYILAHRMYLP